MRDEMVQDQRCAVCGSLLMPFGEEPGETVDFREEDEAGQDRLICPQCRTHLLYVEGSESEP